MYKEKQRERERKRRRKKNKTKATTQRYLPADVEEEEVETRSRLSKCIDMQGASRSHLFITSADASSCADSFYSESFLDCVGSRSHSPPLVAG